MEQVYDALQAQVRSQSLVYERDTAMQSLSDKQAGQTAPNSPLREIAGRIHKLSFRDMQRLAYAIDVALPGEATTQNLCTALLTAADALEKA